ncbi:alpha-amylase family glycosyl hydrolase [Lederbergia citrea]|uniref:alpha-amylase n=1 Tax=Lederbergia citrea TaxID=2833581 RepID=A0A942UNT2_9BACI|nr:alpha-amylase family glycosyl hydrolase [Lederbergia citrea]MBS4204101.1 alpha-amylase [Lederbergia citrea]MBS4221314.1 alpha-amylase [Lederbergia citrea]
MFKKALCFFLAPLLLFSAFSVKADKKEERLWQDEVIYSLMVDRFNNGDNKNDFDVNMKDPLSYQGGDFQGIIDKLDYLQEMGFTVIQLSPIFDNEEGGYHGEWIKDYYKTEEHFGTIEDFVRLVDESHKRSMKIILEFPIKDLDSKEILEVAKWWVTETNIDGLKITDIDYMPMTFWTEFASELSKLKKDFYLSGAAANLNEEMISQYLHAGFTSMLDVSLNEPLRNVFSKPDVSLAPLFDLWEQNKDTAGLKEAFLDNQNTERFTRDMVNNNTYPGSRWKMALTYLYTQPEIPSVYYASEIAVNGGKAPENTPMMNFRTDQELIEYISKLGKIRQDQIALTRGTMELLYENNGMAVFKRQYESDTVVVAINSTSADQTAVITADQLEDNKELRGLLGTDMVRSNNGEYEIFIEREAAEIYKMTEKSGYNITFILSIFLIFGVFALFMYIVWKRGQNRQPDK